MATSVTTQPTQATGDTIEAAYSNTNRDNVAIVDARTGGDPGAAGKVLGSSGPLAGVWTTIAALLGYTPVNKAGDTMTGTLQIANTGSPTTGYLILGNDSGKYFGFDGTQFVIVGDSLSVAGLITAVSGLLSTGDLQAYRSGAPTTGYLILGNSGAHYVGFDGTNIVADGSKIWTDGNDGPASGLAAQTAATATSATSATDATNVTSTVGSVAIANYARKDAASNFTTAPTINGAAVAKIATGTFAGGGGSSVQKTAGFICKGVLLIGNTGGTHMVAVILSTSAALNFKVTGNGVTLGGFSTMSATALHASDGFVVDNLDGTDVSGNNYAWVAFG